MNQSFKSILFIDDKVADNRYNQIILKKMNIIDEIETADNCEEALRMLEFTDHSKPKLVFLDINMPKMNGWEFLEAYEKFDASIKNKKTIIILTTSINPEDKVKAKEIECVSEFYSKPLTPEMLKDILTKYSPATDEHS